MVAQMSQFALLLGGCMHPGGLEKRHIRWGLGTLPSTRAKDLVYQRATVVQPLAPAGKVTIQGVLWNAVFWSGETIEMGRRWK